MKVRFEREKETKNTVRYKEVTEEGQSSVIGTLYVQKWFARNCTQLNVTIEEVEEQDKS